MFKSGDPVRPLPACSDAVLRSGRLKALGFGRDPRHATHGGLSLVQGLGLSGLLGGIIRPAWVEAKAWARRPMLSWEVFAGGGNFPGRTGFAWIRAASVQVVEWTCFQGFWASSFANAHRCICQST